MEDIAYKEAEEIIRQAERLESQIQQKTEILTKEIEE